MVGLEQLAWLFQTLRSEGFHILLLSHASRADMLLIEAFHRISVTAEKTLEWSKVEREVLISVLD